MRRARPRTGEGGGVKGLEVTGAAEGETSRMQTAAPGKEGRKRVNV